MISSADRNSTIDIVFIRSFFVGQDRTPDLTMEEFLDFTLNRLRKRYSEEDSENMFFEDEIYAKYFIQVLCESFLCITIRQMIEICLKIRYTIIVL